MLVQYQDDITAFDVEVERVGALLWLPFRNKPPAVVEVKHAAIASFDQKLVRVCRVRVTDSLLSNTKAGCSIRYSRVSEKQLATRQQLYSTNDKWLGNAGSSLVSRNITKAFAKWYVFTGPKKLKLQAYQCTQSVPHYLCRAFWECPRRGGGRASSMPLECANLQKRQD